MAAQSVWVAIDGDQVKGIFTTELLASRCALEESCAVMVWPFGASLSEARVAEDARRAKLVKASAQPSSGAGQAAGTDSSTRRRRPSDSGTVVPE